MTDANTIRRRKRNRAGQRAEWLALFYMMSKGYLPVAMRYKTPQGEIDLVMRRGKTLVFVEVKARASREDAAFAIHSKNQTRIVNAARAFLSTYANFQGWNIRFDAIMIAWYRWPHHITHAFS